MRRFLRAAALAIALTICCGGCDDGNQTCPDVEGFELYLIGEAAYTGPAELFVDIDVFDVARSGLEVSEAWADDYQLCVRSVPHSASEDGHQIIRTWSGGDCWSGALPAFTVVDTVQFTFQCGDVAHDVLLPMLSHEVAPHSLLLTVDETNDTLTASWAPIAQAEWYALRIWSKGNFSGWYGWEYDCVDVPTVTRPLHLSHDLLLEVIVYVAAGTGPRPDDAGPDVNLDGPHIVGALYSLSGESSATWASDMSRDATRTTAAGPAEAPALDAEIRRGAFLE